MKACVARDVRSLQLSCRAGEAADVAAGKALAEESCADCHGDDGAGDDDYPAITGLSVEKFTKAIQEYQDGTRRRARR